MDSAIWYRINALSRFLLLHCASAFVPYFLVNEFPKSGGSWLGQMLANGLNVPFPRNRLPMLRASIMHGHYLRPGVMRNVVILWRDGRDVLVSLYYHSLFKNDKWNQRLVERVRSELSFRDYNDIESNLPDFIHYVYTSRKHFRFNWAEFVEHWIGRDNVVYVKYEDLRNDTSGQLIRVIRELHGVGISETLAHEIAGKYSFENMSGRKPGQQLSNSFLRKGIVGDWKNHFSPESRSIFDRYAGDALVALGYESDSGWVARK